MKYLIRFVSRNPAGGVEHHDKIVDAPVITIGRATDQVLHLKDRRARLQHATIEQQSDGVHITTGALSGVSVNGRSQRDAKLEMDDVIEVGANILRVIEAPGGIDFAVSFELSAEASADHFVTDWSSPAVGVGGWSKRRLSWALAGVVVLFAFLLPGLSLLEPLKAVTRSTALPDDSLWLSGPVHSAHSSTATECEACHVKPFRRVPDMACMECHAASRHVADAGVNVLGEVRCASCHLEHNEPPELVKRHQGLCADCHQELPPDVELEDAADFLDSHPAFKVNLLRPSAAPDNSTEWRTEHVLLNEARDGDRSNLTFNHAVHLDDAGIVTPDGRRVI
ncbi:MAG: FHA domain-containing protein, partial [Gammaproteobacteria bacterium]